MQKGREELEARGAISEDRVPKELKECGALSHLPLMCSISSERNRGLGCRKSTYIFP